MEVKVARSFFPGITINAAKASGPYTVRCSRCRGWSQQARTISTAVMAAAVHHGKRQHGKASASS